MDTTTSDTTARSATTRAAANESTHSDVVGAPSTAGDQPTLPFEPLPYDDEADEPIAYALTARARLRVAPDQVPPLEVVDTTPLDSSFDPDDPHDTRPARARALRRAGLTPARIAEQLNVDELLVDAWVGHVRAWRRGRGRTRTVVALGDSGAQDDRGAGVVADGPADALLVERRESARLAARSSLESDPAFSLGLGLLMGVASLDRHAVTMRTQRPDVATRGLSWLRSHLDLDERRVRMVLRIAPRIAADLARHQWSAVTGVPVERIATSWWSDAPTEQTVEALVRVGDPTVAAILAGYCDALDDPREDDPRLDVAF